MFNGKINHGVAFRLASIKLLINNDVEKGGSTVEKTNDDKEILVEEMAMFPGGDKAMPPWISDNLKYPGEAVNNKITGLINVNFVVSSTGKIKNVRVRKSVNTLLDAEAVRVIENMPDWTPGKQNGKPVDVD